MPPASARLQWFGILLVGISAAMPVFAWRIGTPGLPPALQPGPRRVALIGPPGPTRVPVMELVGAAKGASGVSSLTGALWSRRPIYSYALLPFWILALWLVRRRPRAAGLALWGLTVCVIGIEAIYLSGDYRPFFPSLLGKIETGMVWCVVCTMLIYRRPRHRRLAAVEGTLAAMALLAFVHGVTLPFTLARDYVDTESFGEVLARVGDAFPAGFWIGMIGFALVAIPGYVSAGFPATRSPDVGPVRDRSGN